MIKIGIIGGGNMGEAILKGIRKKYSVSVCEASASRRNQLKKKYRVATKDLKAVIQSCTVIILAVKPQNIDQVLSAIHENLKKNTLFISIAAGITSSYIEKRLGQKARVIRTMPNMPAQIGEGITALSKGKSAKKSDLSKARQIFDCVGKTTIVNENMIDAVTAVSGSGPAYVFLFVEAMVKAGESLGLTKKISTELVLQTLMGSAHLLEASSDDAATLRSKVTSKGGTTYAALSVFKKYRTEKIFKEALGAARKRAKKLSKK